MLKTYIMQVQQPFDSSANYYTQVYHTGTEGDGRYAPFCPTGATIKYTTALSSNTDLSQQEVCFEFLMHVFFVSFSFLYICQL